MTTTTAVLGRVLTPDGWVDDGAVVVTGGAIVWVGPAAAADGAGHRDAVAAAGRPEPGTLVLPGLVDLHCHGGGGASFPDARDADEVRAAAREHLRHGTTSLVASLVTAAADTLRERVALLAGLAAEGEVAGIHLEGPFLSAARCGAQDPDLIVEPDGDLAADLLDLGRGHVVTMTLAPEAPGAAEVAEVLAARGALPSWGHTDAGPADARAALVRSAATLARPGARSGRPTVTHLFNGMRPWHHRDPGPAGEFLAAAAAGRAVVELIGDGTHLHPAVVAEVVALVGRDNVALVTDAMAAAGMPDGRYRLGSMDVVVADRVARLADGGAIAGGTAHLLDVVRTTAAGGVPLADAVHMATAVPARALGAADRGALAPGRRADLLLTDDVLRPLRVLRHGQEVHR